MNSLDGKLQSAEADESTLDYRIEMVTLFKKGKINEARKILCSQARPEEMEEIYRWMYDNIELFGKDDHTRDSAVLIIKQGLVDHALVSDAEINLSATLIRLARINE
jgi:hypothetical protein